MQFTIISGGDNTKMTTDTFKEIFSSATLARVFPAERANEFFEALYGDVEEGVYDISLDFKGYSAEDNTLHFALNLTERPGKCLACHLTYGLPEVFSRHPIINIRGVIAEIDKLLGDDYTCGDWSLGSTQSVSKKLFAVPLAIRLN